MKRKCLLIAFSLMAYVLHAQSLPHLTIPSDPYSISVSGASVAMDAHTFSIYSNPAAISFSNKTVAIGAAYSVWQPSVSNNTIYNGAGYFKISKSVGIALSGRVFSYRPYEVTDATGSIIGTYTPKEMDFALGTSFKVIDIISIGASIRYINSAIGDNYRGSAVCADLAIMAKISGLNISLSAANVGSKINYGTSPFNLPSMAKVGAAYNLQISEDNRLSVNAEGDYLLKGSSFMAGAGLEFCHKEMVSFRAGYHYGDGVAAIGSYASVGLGLKLFGLSLNAAYLLPTGNSVLKNSVSVSLGFEF